MTSGVYERSDTMRTHLGMLMQERWKSPEWRQKMDNVFRIPCSEEKKKKIGNANAKNGVLFKKGQKPWNTGLTKRTDLRVKKMGEATSKGKKNHNWKGNKRKLSNGLITIEKYNELYTEQRGLCAICGKPESRKSNHGKTCKLMVDHNHKQNKVRALLCHKCNVGLGLFADDIDLMSNAIKYLKKHGGGAEL